MGPGFHLTREYQMKKIMALAGVSMAAIALLTAAPAAMAQTAPATNVVTTWSGSGNLGQNGTAAGSTGMAFSTAGNQIAGTLTFNNLGNNPYNYGVSNVNTNLNASVASGGEISILVNRTGSYAPLYGAAGQSISGYAFSNDGNAAMVMNSGVNYASMNDVGYGQARTAGGNTMDASGSIFQLNYTVDTGIAGNNGGITVVGTGSAALRQNFSGVSAGGFTMGSGGGITPVATVQANGTGTIQFGGITTNTLNVLGNTVVGTAANPGSFTGTVNYSGAQSWNNYGVSVTSGAPAIPPANPN